MAISIAQSAYTITIDGKVLTLSISETLMALVKELAAEQDTYTTLTARLAKSSAALTDIQNRFLALAGQPAPAPAPAPATVVIPAPAPVVPAPVGAPTPVAVEVAAATNVSPPPAPAPAPTFLSKVQAFLNTRVW